VTVDVLAFGPHPDDVELFCGGTLIRLGQLGHRTAVVDLTRGERASHGTPEERARECEAASAILGLAQRENLGLPDTQLAAIPAHIVPVVDAIRRLRPELVLLPWSEERHPDHVATAAIVKAAAFYAGVRNYPGATGERFVPRQILSYALRHRMPPSFVVDTSAAAADKERAIRCYTSQVTRRPGEDATLVSAPLSLASLDARDRYYGSLIGVSHGEPLRAVATLGLTDPVAHFRANPFTDPQGFE
jgi:N-acetylglucosamine malate deacetylase 1